VKRNKQNFLAGRLVVLLLLCVSAVAQKPIRDLKPTVILISLDGFRYDYPDKFKPPVLNELARTGVRAKWMTPLFPADTFPNHYSIATGLYPEHHGIIGNYINDSGVSFSYKKAENNFESRWWGGEPIWVTTEKQGQRAGNYFWVGSAAEIAGVRSTLWKAYDDKIPNNERVDTILSWLDLPSEKRPTLFLLYFNDVDAAGHDFGPDSKEVADAVQKVDNNIGQLIEGLKKRKIAKKVNIIVVSDHGMAQVDLHNAVFLDDIFDLRLAEPIVWSNELVQIFPKKEEETKIISALQSKINHAKCWRKSEIPERFHYQSSPRIAPVVCLPEVGWILTSHSRYESLKKEKDINQPHGEHGYDNQSESMRATFIARGAAFKKNKIVEPFENIGVYNIITRILNLTPAKTDGDYKAAKEVLRLKIKQ
jgi:predicted AlkP superfamily pyrophosphatase or phosphodiesterase